MAYQNRGLGIDDLTIGVSAAGVEEYIAALKAEYLTSVKDRINDVTAVNNALDKGWQGQSRDNFDKIFQSARETIIWDLEKEFVQLRSRLNELAGNYLEQDQKMIDN